MFHERGLTGTDEQQRALIDFYQGNPLALKIVSTTIQDLFDGDIAQFLASNPGVFGDIRDLLEQQGDRLSELERSVMFWLAVHREPVTISALQELVWGFGKLSRGIAIPCTALLNRENHDSVHPPTCGDGILYRFADSASEL
ncbi:MAG: hypothetical protein HC899_36350 [Leptolyngbyaceae cyanobacterium SM1_4_3]|nr:hypothetical protein [Leptolyngbyaceae cyanobacterium SM1_4_3]